MEFTSFYQAAAPAIFIHGKLPTFVQTGITGQAASLFGRQHQRLVLWGSITSCRSPQKKKTQMLGYVEAVARIPSSTRMATKKGSHPASERRLHAKESRPPPRDPRPNTEPDLVEKRPCNSVTFAFARLQLHASSSRERMHFPGGKASGTRFTQQRSR